MAEADFEGVPFRLYLSLEQGHVADLIAVSQASIAIATGIKEIAYLLDPTLELNVGLMPQLRGSIWQNTILRAQAEYTRRRVLYQLAAASAIWFIQPPLERVRDNMWRPFLEEYLPDASGEETQQVQRVVGPDVAERARQSAYSAFYRDERIIGVGVSKDRRRPSSELIVPRSEFQRQSGKQEIEATELDRATVGPLHVVLVSPVLDPGTRRWKFATAQGEFGASIKDQEFLDAVLAGELLVPLRAGIEMDIQLETRERLIDGVWQVAERSVVKVENVTAPRSSRQMPLFPPDNP